MKILLLSIFFLSLTSLVYAQTPVQQTVKVDVTQVPIAVRIALDNDFNIKADDGAWLVHMTRTQESGKILTEPEWYSFYKRNKNEKIEVRYSPEGELLMSKGIPDSNNTGTKEVARKGKK